jgi:hypothetical protein
MLGPRQHYPKMGYRYLLAIDRIGCCRFTAHRYAMQHELVPIEIEIDPILTEPTSLTTQLLFIKACGCDQITDWDR